MSATTAIKTKGKHIAKLYDCFDHMERINLVLAALARNDREEMEKLRATCPKKRYLSIDLDYINCSTNFGHAMSSFILSYENLYWRHSLAIMGKCSYEIMRHYEDTLLLLADNDSECPKEFVAQREQYLSNFTQLESECAKTEQQLLIKFKALFEGFRAFCTEIGIDYKSAIACLTPSVTDGFAILKDSAFATIEPDVGFREKMQKEFLILWQRHN